MIVMMLLSLAYSLTLLLSILFFCRHDLLGSPINYVSSENDEHSLPTELRMSDGKTLLDREAVLKANQVYGGEGGIAHVTQDIFAQRTVQWNNK